MSEVVIVTNIPSPYRVDLFYYLQNNLNEHHFSVIYTNRNEDNRLWTIPEDRLIDTCVLDSHIIKVKGMNGERYIHLPGNIGKTLNRINPDIVIAWEYNPAALQALRWCKTHGKKFIHLTDGTLHAERNINFAQKFSRKMITKRCDAAIASSTKAKEKLLAWGMREKDIFISRLTVDIEPLIERMKTSAQSENDEKILLYVGRLTYGKGLDLLFRALPHISSKYTLRLVGDGEEKEIEKFRKQAAELGIIDRIEFCGFKQGESLFEEYRRADLFVFPTREDCFGLVLLEAMCAGKPIIASQYAGGAYDTVENGFNGFILDPRDAMEFSKRIDEVLTHPEYAENSKRYSTEHSGQFAFAEVSKGYSAAIDYVKGKV